MSNKYYRLIREVENFINKENKINFELILIRGKLVELENEINENTTYLITGPIKDKDKY